MRKLLALAALAAALAFGCGPARAQNNLCADVALGDSSNRCANTRFVATTTAGFPTLAGNNTWIGTNTFNPLAGDAITINPLAGTINKSILSTQTSQTSGSVAGPLSFNLFNITQSVRVTGAGSDNTGNNNAGSVGFRVNTFYTGANLAGASTLLSGLFSATVTSTAALGDVVGLAGTAYTNVIMSHTGFLEGMNAVVTVGPTGSANIITGMDAGSGIQAGGAANYRLGLDVGSSGATRGTTLDTAIAIMGLGGNPAWGKVFAFTNLAGAAPINATTDIFYADTVYTVANVFNLSTMVVTGSILNFPNVHLLGNGSLSLGTTNTAGAGSITATGTIGTNGTLASGGAAVGNGVLSLGGNTSGGWNLTGNATGTLATATGSLATSGVITDSNNGIGTVSTDGLVLQNTTAAAAGAQQYSPRLHFIGQGWKTNATAASQTVDWILENEPGQGTAAPSSFLAFLSQINAGGYTAQISISSGGVLNVATGVQIAGVAASGNGLRGNGTNFVSAPFAPSDLSPNALAKVKVQKFIASGTYTPSTGTISAIIECVGGGAGGGSASGTAGQFYAGGGGGSGGYSRAYVTAATIGASQTVTIGGGGNGGASGSNNGSVGVDTSVGALCVGKGGSGGLFGSAAQVGGGGAGGVAGTGDVAATGNVGAAGLYAGISTVAFPSGSGASSIFGGGVPGVQTASGTCSAGSNAGNYGGGGSAAVCNNVGATNAAGGNGSGGIVVVTEFTNQ